MSKKPTAGKTCERCGKWKDIQQMAAFFPEGADTSDPANRISWCFACIDEDLKLKGKYDETGRLAPEKVIPKVYRWDTGKEISHFQMYYQTHKEERQAYQRRRYYEIRGMKVPSTKRSYTKPTRPDASSPFVPAGLLEEDRLRKLLLRKQDWMMSCLRDWLDQPNEEGKNQAAIVYHDAAIEVDELRERLSLPPQKLVGDAERDAVFIREIEETNRNEAETNHGEEDRSETPVESDSVVASELEP